MALPRRELGSFGSQLWRDRRLRRELGSFGSQLRRDWRLRRELGSFGSQRWRDWRLWRELGSFGSQRWLDRQLRWELGSFGSQRWLNSICQREKAPAASRRDALRFRCQHISACHTVQDMPFSGNQRALPFMTSHSPEISVRCRQRRAILRRSGRGLRPSGGRRHAASIQPAPALLPGRMRLAAARIPRRTLAPIRA